MPDHVSPQARFFLNKIFAKDPDRRPSAKDILRDSFLEISQQEYEMLSPRHAHGFANNKDMLNYERGSAMNFTQKANGMRGGPAMVKGGGIHPMVINPQNINFAHGTGSKDKRLTMFPNRLRNL